MVAPMTQFPDTADNTQQDSQGNMVELSPAGYIKKVVLWNFMCHEHFELELGSRLNFIVGNNGSGKSAILTAITVGLGARALDTNRGNSLKDLIREGCHSTKIRLHLDNSNHGSYNKGTFGNEIIIERTIKDDGTSNFSLKSETSKEISSKKKDIQAVVDFFSVPISNPMCFLSQDAARSFLTASTSHEKYNHFMKGTLLQDINNHLEQARSISKAAQENMALHLDNLNNLKEEYEDSKKLIRELSETTDLNQRKRLLQGKSLWLDVEQNEQVCRRLKDEVSVYEAKIENTRTKMRTKQEKIDRISVDKTAIEKEIEDKVLFVAEKDSEHQEARDVLRNFRSRYDTEKQNKKEAESSINQCEQKIRVLDQQIARLEEEMRSEMGGDKEQMRQEIITMENHNEHLKQVINSLFLTLQDLQNDERRVVQERDVEIQNFKDDVSRKRNELREMSEGSRNFLNNFDDKMVHLLQVINKRAQEFESSPVGPIGNLIKVKKGYEKWARPIQRVINSTLSSFVVGSHRDNRLFREIVRSCRIRANLPVITYELTSFDYSNGKADCGYPTIADALEFTNSEIECLVVDQNRIEKIVLVEDRDEARRLLRQQPRNVGMTLALRDHRSGYQISGGYRLDTVTYQDIIRMRVGSSSEDSMSYVKDLIEQEIRDMQIIKDNYNDKLDSIRSEIHTVDREHRKYKNQMKDNNAKITELKINVGKEVDTGILTSKANEKKTQEQAITGYKAALEGLGIKIQQLTQESGPIHERSVATKTALLAAQSELNELREDINNRHSRVDRLHDDIKHYEGKIISYHEVIVKTKENIKTLESGIRNQRRGAEQFCSEEQLRNADIPDDQKKIRDELNKITRSMKKAERRMGLPQEKILEIYEKSRDKYKEGQEKFIQMDRALEQLYNSIQIRLQNLQAAQRTTCLDADLDFRASLKVRNFNGNLSFITHSKRLEIFILTPNDEKARNVDTLSGGEKSFSQMALLLATWKPMRSRIIALDEFDVFMDQVNRQIGTKLILNKLKDIARTQTIIITPQDIGKIADINSDGVNVHRMKDPQRQNNSSYYENS